MNLSQPPDNVVRRRIVIRGRVQGVGYRAFVARHATSVADLAGSVRNLDDGAVECVVEGPPGPVQALIEELRVGPGLAHVSDMRVTEEAPVGLSGPFTIRG